MTTVIGILLLGHGIFWAMMRLTRPHLFKQVYTLAQRLGFRSPALYFTCFVLVPLAAGIVLLTAGMGGFPWSGAVQ